MGSKKRLQTVRIVEGREREREKTRLGKRKNSISALASSACVPFSMIRAFSACDASRVSQDNSTLALLQREKDEPAAPKENFLACKLNHF